MNLNQDQHFSIIMPTFQEAKNISALIQRIAAIDFGTTQFEVIIVDDNSNDGMMETIQQLQPHYPWLKLIVRQDKKGLCHSILTGMQRALFSTWVIMDADLSHPPEKIPELLTALHAHPVDLVIGSRYVKGGSSDSRLPLLRKIFSRLAVLLTRPLIGFQVKDPLSGFLALKKSTYLSGNPLKPIGWKIGLEIMIKCHCRRIEEIPIHFSKRNQGVSKLNLKIVLSYLHHLSHLFWFEYVTTHKK